MLTPEQQREVDRNTIKVRLIENAILVNVGEGLVSFPDWSQASQHIEGRIESLKKKRKENPR